MEKIAMFGVVLLFLLLPFASGVSAADSLGIDEASVVWYYLYLHENQTFQVLYNSSIAAGVDNATLTRALALYRNSTVEYRLATAYGIPLGKSEVHWLPFMLHIRRAYMDILKATVMIQGALQSRGVVPEAY